MRKGTFSLWDIVFEVFCSCHCGCCCWSVKAGEMWSWFLLRCPDYRLSVIVNEPAHSNPVSPHLPLHSGMSAHNKNASSQELSTVLDSLSRLADLEQRIAGLEKENKYDRMKEVENPGGANQRTSIEFRKKRAAAEAQGPVGISYQIRPKAAEGTTLRSAVMFDVCCVMCACAVWGRLLCIEECEYQ
jgi:hypothetical protein